MHHLQCWILADFRVPPWIIHFHHCFVLSPLALWLPAHEFQIDSAPEMHVDPKQSFGWGTRGVEFPSDPTDPLNKRTANRPCSIGMAGANPLSLVEESKVQPQ